jgi:hypothetical protein
VIGDSEGLPTRAELDALENTDVRASGAAGNHRKTPKTLA